MKRAILLLLLLAIAVAIWWEQRPRPQTLVLTGTVDGNEVVVGSKITGRIVSLAVDDGQRVKAGDLIAVLDQDELRADQGAAGHAIAQARASAQQSVAQTELLEKTLPTKVRQAQAQMAQAQAQLRQAQAQWAQTQAPVQKAQDNFNRIRPLVQRDINPPQDLVTVQTDLDSAKANEQAAQAWVEAMQRAVTAAQAALADAEQEESQVAVQQRQTAALRAAEAQAEANAAAATARFSQTRIFAPASGIVTLRAARQGEVVNPGSPIITLFDLSSTWVDADVEETYADLIAMGQALRVRLPSGSEITGPVIYKAVEADFATQRDVSRTKRDIKTVAIRVRVPNPEGRLPLGMTAWVMLPVPALPPPPPVSSRKD
jgi:HlyD family secretion protein